MRSSCGKTATVLAPSSVAARNARTAISPRLATRILANTVGTSRSGWARHPAAGPVACSLVTRAHRRPGPSSLRTRAAESVGGRRHARRRYNGPNPYQLPRRLPLASPSSHHYDAGHVRAGRTHGSNRGSAPERRRAAARRAGLQAGARTGRWSGFSNFAISFSIISILAGCFTTFGQAWNNGGPIAISIGWPLISVFILIIGFCMSELVSAYPTSGGIYWWASKLGGAKAGYYTGWLNLIGLLAIDASVAYGTATFFDLSFSTMSESWAGGLQPHPGLLALPRRPRPHRADQHLRRAHPRHAQQHLGVVARRRVPRSSSSS